MMNNGAIRPHRFAFYFPTICPYGVYKAKKGYIAFAVAEHQWPPLVKAMGIRPELATDSRYDTQKGRCARRPEVRKYIEDWLQTFADDETPLTILLRSAHSYRPGARHPRCRCSPSISRTSIVPDLAASNSRLDTGSEVSVSHLKRHRRDSFPCPVVW